MQREERVREDRLERCCSSQGQISGEAALASYMHNQQHQDVGTNSMQLSPPDQMPHEQSRWAGRVGCPDDARCGSARAWKEDCKVLN